MHQTTIDHAVECSGIGLHSGKLVSLRLLPAAADSGILFSLRTGRSTRFVRPSPEAVVATQLSTTLGQGDARVATVEHLLAAVRGLHIDNLLIEVTGGEIPIMDGSAASFVFLLHTAGVRVLNRPRTIFRLRQPFSLESEGKWIKARPYNGVRIDCTIAFPHPLIGEQSLSLELTPEAFARKLAKARTFGFLKQVEALHRNGLALGGSLDNAIVLDDFGIVNTEGLRYADEFVRHKVLDFIGDLAVLDYPLHGHFEAFCSGHALNNAFVRTLETNRALYLEEWRPAPVQEPESEPFLPARAPATYAA